MSGQYAGVLLYSDLDGTLLTPQRTLSPENLEAIHRFVSQGGLFGVATGRMERSLQLNFPALPTNLPCIFYNGALIQWHPDGPVLLKRALETDPVPQLKAVMAACPGVGIEVLSGGQAYVQQINEPMRAQLGREGLQGIPADWPDIPAGWYKVLLTGERPALAEARRMLEDLGKGSYDLVYSEDTLLEILQPNVSKGSALHWVKARYAGRVNLTVAVGDNDNDADMLAVADLGIAMENGTARAKAGADHVVPDNREACLPHVLAWIDRRLQETAR